MSRRNILGRHGLRQLAVVSVLCLSAACTPIYRNHGYIPVEEDLSLLTIGVDTRETVIQAVGTPTSGGVLSENAYYYVSSRFRHYGFLQPAEIEREVMAISFDAAGRVSNIERFGLDQGQVVTLSRRVTDDNIQDVTFLQQLFGNIGNFDATSVFGSDG